MSRQRSLNLWHITEGQRLPYFGAVVSMALMNAFMFGAPLIGKFAIDVVVERDFSYAQPQLLGIAQAMGDGSPYLNYLMISAVLAVLVTAMGGLFLFFRGRLAATASEAIVRQLRETIYRRMHNLHAAFYDTADTGDSSELELSEEPVDSGLSERSSGQLSPT